MRGSKLERIPLGGLVNVKDIRSQLPSMAGGTIAKWERVKKKKEQCRTEIQRSGSGQQRRVRGGGKDSESGSGIKNDQHFILLQFQEGKCNGVNRRERERQSAIGEAKNLVVF